MDSEITLSKSYKTRSGKAVYLLEVLPATQRFRFLGVARIGGMPPWTMGQWTVHGSYVIPPTGEHPMDLIEAEQQGLF